MYAILQMHFFGGDVKEFLSTNYSYAGTTLLEYLQAYPHQITISFIYSILFRLMLFPLREFLRLYNVIGNIIIVIFLYKIGKQLSKEYKVNKTFLLFLSLTFISLPLLSTFVYGDIPSLALCLISVYFMMRYTETKKLVYPIFASIFTAIAYMLRMNSLIFIIATVMYLMFNLCKDFFKKTGKIRLLEISIIVFYIAISFIPSSIIKNYYMQKYGIDKEKNYPITSFLLFSMEEGTRSNGWYNEDIAEPALRDPVSVKEEYKEKLKERIIYLLKNPKYTFDFYTTKIASMWTENTYSSIRNNSVQDFSFENIINPLTFYQKVLLILSSVCSLIVLIQNRKNLSLNLIFLITIFIGGFMFHILWEAKSRYIIPYVIILIPVASVEINHFHLFFNRKKL